MLGEFVDVSGVGEALEFVEEAEGRRLKARLGRVAVGYDSLDFDAYHEGF